MTGRYRQAGQPTQTRRGQWRRRRWLAVAAVTVVVLGGAVGCGSSSSGHPTKGAAGQDQIVVRVAGVKVEGSYVAMRPDGTGRHSLGINSHDLAGFTRDLSRVVAADPGDPNRDGAAQQTTISVGSVGHHLKTVWTLGDELTTLPVWNPAGTKVALGLARTQDRSGTFAPHGVPTGLWIMNPDGTHRHLLLRGGVQNLTWSPNGSMLAFGGFGGFATVSVSGGKPTVRPSPGVSYEEQPFSWSPDGKSVLVAYGAVTGVQANGSGVDAYPASGGPPQVVIPRQMLVNYNGAIYSPDGSHIAIVETPRLQLSTQLEIVNADGSAAKPVASFDSPSDLVGWYRT